VDQIDNILILSGDHVYKMNYGRMLKEHVESGADITISATDVPLEQAAQRFGVIQAEADGRVIGFAEKPAHPTPTLQDPNKALVSMGIYVFNSTFLEQVLEEDAKNPDSSHDFGKDIIPSLIRTRNVHAHHFVDENKKEETHWLDIGTIDAYYAANMDLVAVSPHFNLYDTEWPIRTYQRQYPPAKFVFAQEGLRVGVALDSIVSNGCIISGGRVVNSILSPGVCVHSYSNVENSILFAHADIGEHSRIRNCIVESGVHLPSHTVVGYDQEADRKRFHVTDRGITVISKEDVSPEG
jgi:glucose-1-phosphate adenylyltransferase